MCGSLSYEADIDGVSILNSDTVPPIAYDALIQEFKVFSEDLNFLGSKSLSIKSFLTEFAMITHEVSFTLVVSNPCPDASLVTISGTAPEQ